MVCSTSLTGRYRDSLVGVSNFLEHLFHLTLNFIKVFWMHPEQRECQRCYVNILIYLKNRNFSFGLAPKPTLSIYNKMHEVGRIVFIIEFYKFSPCINSLFALGLSKRVSILPKHKSHFLSTNGTKKNWLFLCLRKPNINERMQFNTTKHKEDMRPVMNLWYGQSSLLRCFCNCTIRKGIVNLSIQWIVLQIINTRSDLCSNCITSNFY